MTAEETFAEYRIVTPDGLSHGPYRPVQSGMAALLSAETEELRSIYGAPTEDWRVYRRMVTATPWVQME